MTEQRRIEVEIEVPATPEQAWEAIATGPGITAWFMPTEVEGRVGGTVVHHHDEVVGDSGTIIAYEPPHRFGYEEEVGEFVPGAEPGPHLTATEFLVVARGGGTCVVRVVMSGFGDGDAWERAIESFTKGWRQALLSLRLYLAHFRGEPVSSINAGVMVKSTESAVWNRLTESLGLPAQPVPGDRVAATAAGVPEFAGTVEAVRDGLLTLVLERPARGIGLVGVGGPGGEEVYATVRAQLFGTGAADVVSREQPVWVSWFRTFA